MSRCARAFSRTNVTEPPRCRITTARNDPRFLAKGATRMCVLRAQERKREHTRYPKAFQTLPSISVLFIVARRPFERPARRTVYQRFYRVLPLARTHDLSIGRFVTSITEQAIELYKRLVDCTFSTICNRDRYPARTLQAINGVL